MLGLNSGLLGVRRVPTTTSASGLWFPNEQSLAKRGGIWPGNLADPYFNNVSLLLHMNGSNGSTTFIDSSSNALTVTANGNAQISTAQSKFGGASALFDGNGDYLQTSTSTNLSLGNSDFTIELWARRGQSAPANANFLQMSAGADLYSMLFGYTVSSELQVYISSNNSSWDIANGKLLGIPLVDTWVFYAITRSGSNFYTFQDGTQQSTWTSSASIYQASNQVTIGKSQNTASEDYKGYIDDLRITKGVARYTANFTPPTAPFPNS